jgi:hypothetical protein
MRVVANYPRTRVAHSLAQFVAVACGGIDDYFIALHKSILPLGPIGAETVSTFRPKENAGQSPACRENPALEKEVADGHDNQNECSDNARQFGVIIVLAVVYFGYP